MMKVSEISMLLGVSTRTIYRKVEKLELNGKGYVKQENNAQTITNEGLELIKKSLTRKGVEQSKSQSDNVKDTEQHINESYERIIELQAVTFRETIADLRHQLIEKDILIEDLRKDKNRLMQMQENSQVLLVREQERVLMLEENKGFWSKFKKKQPN